MSRQENRKCFTFIWTLENVSYFSQKRNESLRSPLFVIDELKKSKCHLELYLGGQSDENYIDCNLKGENYGLIIDCELELLSKDGLVLTSQKKEECHVFPYFDKFKERKEIFADNKSTYLAEDKLRVCCKIWRKDREMEDNVQCFARSRICTQRQFVLWNIKNFSSIQLEEKITYPIKSVQHKEVWLTLELFIKNPYTDEDLINVQLLTEDANMKYFVFDVVQLNCFSTSTYKGVRKEILFSEKEKQKLVTLPLSKKDLMKNKSMFIPDDILTLRCEFTFSTGYVFEEIETVFYNCENQAEIEQEKPGLDGKITLPESKRILNANLKSMFHENILPDIKLKTSSKTYPAHKSVLSARSPVFKAMFSNDMKEKINECVDIEDLDSDSVYRMLCYIYTAEIQDLQWENACKLYGAADKYEILALRKECSSCLKSKLSPTNACDILIFSETYQDTDLKTFVQEYIFNHDIINSDKWEQLMETHLKLAADTMRLQIQRKKLRNKCFTSPHKIDKNPAARLPFTPVFDISPSPSFTHGTTPPTVTSSNPITTFQFSITTPTDHTSPRKVRKAVRRVPR